MSSLNQKYSLIHKSKILNYSIFIFFVVYFFIGLNIYKDYGITTDEPFQRTSGFYWYLWIINNFFSESSNLAELKNIFSSMEWSQEMIKGKFLEYGVIFDLFAVYLEDIFNTQNSQDVYRLKHFLNFFIFFISSIFFFYLIKHRFKNNFLSLLGVLFYVTSPRIFAESFFNSKDIIFMSFIVIAIFLLEPYFNSVHLTIIYISINILWLAFFEYLNMRVKN